jgi:predicted patatin/cPLA2 family phospholipase
MRTLSLCGGGSCGYMTAIFLSKLEEELGCRVYEIFDLISGVSAGSIIGSCMGHGMSASATANLYKEFSYTIFKKKAWQPWKTWYDSEVLYNLINEIIGFKFNSCKTNVIVYATKINYPNCIEPKFWKSWQENDDIITSDIVVASASAPVYFASKKINENVYVDGGFVANNPSMCSISEVMSKDKDTKNLMNLTINCGSQIGIDNAQKLNTLLRWIPKIGQLTTLALSAGERSVGYQSKQILGNRYLEVGPSINFDMDSIEFDKMNYEGNAMWHRNKENILYYINNSQKGNIQIWH